MKYLVTGATSGLGRNAVDYLLEEGIDDIRTTGRNLQEGALLSLRKVKFFPLDLVQASDDYLQTLLKDIDVIWHCAALSSPWGKLATFHAINVEATSRLAEAAGRLGVKRFIHISTPAIYFDFKHHLNITEEYIANHFANAYAQTKYLAEQRINNIAKKYPETTFVILRPRGLFGLYDRVIIPRLLAQLTQHKNVLKLPRGGETLLDLTFTSNVVHAMQLASSIESISSGSIYNITNQQPTCLKELLSELLAKRLGKQYRIQTIPYPILSTVAKGMELLAHITGKEPMLTAYSAGVLNFDMTLCQQKAIDELGYVPKYNLSNALDITADWLIGNNYG